MMNRRIAIVRRFLNVSMRIIRGRRVVLIDSKCRLSIGLNTGGSGTYFVLFKESGKTIFWFIDSVRVFGRG
jgi:hypothetical protein